MDKMVYIIVSALNREGVGGRGGCIRPKHSYLTQLKVEIVCLHMQNDAAQLAEAQTDSCRQEIPLETLR